MAYDKVVDSARLDGLFQGIAQAIRGKNGASSLYQPEQMAGAIHAITGEPLYQLIIKTESGSTVTAAKGSTVHTAQEKQGIWCFSQLTVGSWTVTCKLGNKTRTVSVPVTSVSDCIILEIKYNVIPAFTYTGDYEIVDDHDTPISTSIDHFKIRFLTSGTLTFTDLRGAARGVEVFLVGGGGKSWCNQYSPATVYYGNGAQVLTGACAVQTEMSYPIVIGAGASVYTSPGGNTTAFGLTAAGGEGITSVNTTGTAVSGTPEFQKSGSRLYGGNSEEPLANTGRASHGSYSAVSGVMPDGACGIVILRSARGEAA